MKGPSDSDCLHFEALPCYSLASMMTVLVSCSVTVFVLARGLRGPSPQPFGLASLGCVMKQHGTVRSSSPEVTHLVAARKKRERGSYQRAFKAHPQRHDSPHPGLASQMHHHLHLSTLSQAGNQVFDAWALRGAYPDHSIPKREETQKGKVSPGPPPEERHRSHLLTYSHSLLPEFSHVVSGHLEGH